jgi:hypothetical protein
MTKPTMNVVFAFDQNAGGLINFFTLDSDVKGLLDNTTYTLGGDFSLVDVTQYVRAVSVSRGRSRLLDRVQSGSATITLDNRARLFDPTAGTAISPYATNIVPLKNVQISVNDEPVFSGLVDDWNIDFQLDGDSTTTAQCVDGFALLGQAQMGTATRSAEASGTRVDAVLTEYGWPSSKRNIDTGQVTLQADTPAENTNVLDYIQTISDTEFGAFYIARAGEATFQDRQAVQNYGTATLFGGTGIPFHSVTIDYGSEQIYNTVTLTRNNGGTATITDATSEAAYGVSELSKTDLLFDNDTELGDLASYLLTLYRNPVLRIRSIELSMDMLTHAQQQSVAAIDVTAPLEVTFTPAVGSAITQYASLDRIDHSITPSNHDVTLAVSQARASFILDSLAFGVLDIDTLGF